MNEKDFRTLSKLLENRWFSLDLSEVELTEIPSRAFMIGGETDFYSDADVEKIILPPTLTTIKDEAFWDCNCLIDVDLSRCINLSYVGVRAFGTCTRLSSMDFSSCAKLNYVGFGAFVCCERLSSIDFSSCTELKNLGGDDAGVLSACRNLEKVILPPNLEIISSCTFQGSSFVEAKIEIPASVKEIQATAFDCGRNNGLREIKICSNKPPMISNRSFSTWIKENTILKVPSGQLLKYKEDKYWGEFLSIEEYNPNGGNLIYHTIQVSFNNGSVKLNGNYIKNDSPNLVTDQTDIRLLFEPKFGYHLNQVIVGSEDMTEEVRDNLLTLSAISSDQMILISFELNIYTVQVSYNDGGTIKVNDNIVTSGSRASVTALSTAKITITPKIGYHIKQVLRSKTDVTSKLKNNVLTISPSSVNEVITITFEKDAPVTHSVKVTYSAGGSVKMNDKSVTSGQSAIVTATTDVKVTITAQVGYHIKQVLLENEDVTSQLSNNVLTVSSISEDKYIAVTFEKDAPVTHTVKVTCSYGGSVKVNDQSVTSGLSVTVAASTDVKVTITPQAGYRIQRVTLKGEDVTDRVSDNVLTISSISANEVLSITFEQIPTYELNINMVGGSSSIKIGDKVITESTRISDIKEGGSISINFQSNDYYEVKKVTLGDDDITAQIQDGFYEIKSVNTNLILNIEYVQKKYRLLVDIQGADKMKINGEYVTDGSYIAMNSGLNSIQIISEHYFIKEILLENKIVYSASSDESQSNSSYASFDERINSDKKLTISTKLRDKRSTFLTLDTPGTLASHLSEEDLKLITDLDIKGKMDQRDFVVINQMQSLFRLNLISATIEKYSTYPANTIPEKAFYNNKNIQTIYLSTSIEAIDKHAFLGSMIFSTISFAENLTKIGEEAFKDCQNLIEAPYIPNISIIEKGVFENCINLTSLNVILSYLIEVKEAAFRNCKNLSITLESDLERIGDYAFENVKSVRWNEDKKFKLSHIGTNALKGCQNCSFDFKNVPYLKELPCFEGYTNINSITLPPNVKEIPEGTFKGCTSLQYVTMNEKIERIAENAFSDSRMTELYVPVNKTPEVYANSFNDFTYSTAKLFVPTDQLPHYRNHPVWGKFKSIEPRGTATYRQFEVLLSKGGRVEVNKTYFGDNDFWLMANTLLFLTSSCMEVYILPDEGYSIESVRLNEENITNALDENNTYVIPYLLVDSQLEVKFKKDNTTSSEMINTDKRIYLSGTNQLSLSGFRIGAHVFVYDVNGRMITHQMISDSVEKISLPSRGIYFLLVDKESIKIVF